MAAGGGWEGRGWRVNNPFNCEVSEKLGAALVVNYREGEHASARVKTGEGTSFTMLSVEGLWERTTTFSTHFKFYIDPFQKWLPI